VKPFLSSRTSQASLPKNSSPPKPKLSLSLFLLLPCRPNPSRPPPSWLSTRPSRGLRASAKTTASKCGTSRRRHFASSACGRSTWPISTRPFRGVRHTRRGGVGLWPWAHTAGPSSCGTSTAGKSFTLSHPRTHIPVRRERERAIFFLSSILARSLSFYGDFFLTFLFLSFSFFFFFLLVLLLGSYVTDVAVSESGKQLWHSTSDGSIYEWNLKTAEVSKSSLSLSCFSCVLRRRNIFNL
jgi:hypothetical protein